MLLRDHFGRLKRALGTALLLHYGAGVFALPVLHAALSDDRPLKAAHFEQLGDRNCAPVHNHTNCAPFGGARLLAQPGATVAIPDDSAAVCGTCLPVSEGPPLAAAINTLGSRAPPLG